jgi:hypothetical protein
MNLNWNDALDGAVPSAGFTPLDPATYRFRPILGRGQTAASQAQMVSVQLEVIGTGPKAGRKVWHNWVLPKEKNDKTKDQMGFFLGAMEVFGLTKDWLIQTFGANEITREGAEYIAQCVVASGRTCKARVSLQKNDNTRNNIDNFAADDGIEPAPPVTANAPAGPPMGMPSAPGMPPGLPLPGFAGSGTPQNPTPAPAWAGGPPAQPQQAPQGFAPAAQAPGQFAQPAPQGQPQFGGPVQGFQGQPNPQGQFPQQAQPALQAQPAAPQQPGQFAGQQFPGQADPANFPPPLGAPQQAAPAQQFAQPQAAPGGYPPPAPQQAPGQQPNFGPAPGAPVPGGLVPGQPQPQFGQPAPAGPQPQFGTGQPPVPGLPPQAPQASF